MFAVTTFYKFVKLDPQKLSSIAAILKERAAELEVSGLLLLAAEGCNATVAARPGQLDAFKQALLAIPEFENTLFKDSRCEKAPFRRFKIDVREEIVTLKQQNCVPEKSSNCHLSPQEWQALLESETDLLLIDTRNFYETEVGMFEGALDLKLDKFSDFPEAVEALNIDKNRKVLMYCTGGIRCEKALISMQRAGFTNVFQLEGGILKYLEHYPDSKFKGECFVFDHRVAVDQNLNPSKQYGLCPHCGNPADQNIVCSLCDRKSLICIHCSATASLNTCSKNCAHHFEKRAQQNGADFNV